MPGGLRVENSFVGPVRFLAANNRQAAALGAPDEKTRAPGSISLHVGHNHSLAGTRIFPETGEVTIPNHWEPKAAASAVSQEPKNFLAHQGNIASPPWEIRWR